MVGFFAKIPPPKPPVAWLGRIQVRRSIQPGINEFAKAQQLPFSIEQIVVTGHVEEVREVRPNRHRHAERRELLRNADRAAGKTSSAPAVGRRPHPARSRRHLERPNVCRSESGQLATAFIWLFLTLTTS